MAKTTTTETTTTETDLFVERCDKPGPGMLCISRIESYSHIPSAAWPSREQAQSFATDPERKSAAAILKRFREQEGIFREHDIVGWSEQLRRLEGNFNAPVILEAQALRKRILEMDHEIMQAAVTAMNVCRKEATLLLKPIFGRMCEKWAQALESAVEARAAVFESMGCPLVRKEQRYSDKTGPYSAEVFELLEDKLLTSLQIRRELARSKSLNLGEVDALATLQWMCTSEDVPVFNWL